MQSSRRVGMRLFGLSAILFFAVDWLSKGIIFQWLGYPEGESFVLIPGWLQFVTRLNNGGIWSLGAEHGLAANLALTGFSCLASVLILIWAYLGIRPGEHLFPIVLGAILAGALGNLHDRLVYQGVRDFIEFHYQDIWYFPTFNVADSCLVCGAACLILSSFWGSTDRSLGTPSNLAAPTT